MGWESINVNELPKETTTERTFEPLPAGRYTLQLLGASENTYRPGAINISTAVADGSEHAGRRVFIDLPNVDEQAWAAPVLARMVDAMGAEMGAYSNPIEELNRIAQNGHSRFSAEVYISNYTKKDGSEGSRNKVNFRSIQAAA
jgi:hypothetical protein